MAKNSVGDHPKGAKKGDGLALDAGQGIKQKMSGNSEKGTSHGPSGTGLDNVLASEKNADEFAKGTVGSPDEVNGIRESANQGSMGEETLLYGGGYFERETAGLQDGISLRDTINADATEPNYNYDTDPLTGSAPERKVGRANNYQVGGKRGNTFLIGEM